MADDTVVSAPELWWETSGVPDGPPAPPVPRARAIWMWVAAGTGVVMLFGTVTAVQLSERGSGGALRTVAPKLAAIAAGCTGVREWNVDSTGVEVINPVIGGGPVQVSYRTNPPSFGRYFSKTAPPRPVAYLPGQPYPIPELLVHNERRGYVVVFYDKTAAQDYPALQEIARAASKEEKFLVVPWSLNRPPFPDGAHVGIATWGITQTCRMLSTDAALRFRKDYPARIAPEYRLP